jgi:hypothetical protein
MKTAPNRKATARNKTDAPPQAGAQAPTAVQPGEPEDAHLTGARRSLQRRVLGLNVRGSRSGSGQAQAERHPDTPPGIHSTGSFTGTEG